jgi:TIGR03009 family protein
MPQIFRTITIVGVLVVCCDMTLGQTPVAQQPQVRFPTSQSQTVQQGTMQAPRIQHQPIKAQPLAVVENGQLIYQRNPAEPQPYPSGVKVAAVPPQSTSTVPLYTGQPVQPPAAQAPLLTAPPQNADGSPQQPVHKGHSKPARRMVPFFLEPEEQQNLDAFLVRWEKYSGNIKRYDVDFNMSTYNPAIPGSDPNKPHKITFGYFKYISNPLRFVYHVEGEWLDDRQIKRDGEKNPQIYAEKVIIDEKTVFKYDYNAKTVIQVNVPPEMIGKGIADSPLPLIFGAKSADLKRRFSMKILPTTNPERIWLQAKPLLSEDQQEFNLVEIVLDRKTLQALGLRKYDINNQGYTVYELKSPKVNDRLTSVLDDLKTWFTPTIERGWKHEVNNWIATNQLSPEQPLSPNSAAPQQSNIPLYRQ